MAHMDREPLSGNYWRGIPIEDAISELAALRAEAEFGAEIISRREEELRDKKALVPCLMAVLSEQKLLPRPPSCLGEIVDVKAVFTRSRQNQKTGLFETIYCCSTACYMTWQKAVQEGRLQP